MILILLNKTIHTGNIIKSLFHQGTEKKNNDSLWIFIYKIYPRSYVCVSH